MSQYWSSSLAEYGVTQTPSRLSVRRGTAGRRAYGAMFILMGGVALAMACGLVPTDETITVGPRLGAVLIGGVFIAIGVSMRKPTRAVDVVFDRAAGTVVFFGGPAEERPVPRRLADVVDVFVEDKNFNDGDEGHRIALLFRSGDLVRLGDAFIGGDSAERAAATIRTFLGPRPR